MYFRRIFSNFHILHSYSEMLHASPIGTQTVSARPFSTKEGQIYIDVGDCACLEEGAILTIYFMRDFRLLLAVFYAACSGKFSPTFRDNLSVPSSGVKIRIYQILTCIYSQTTSGIYIIHYGQPVSVSLLDHLQALFQT